MDSKIRAEQIEKKLVEIERTEDSSNNDHPWKTDNGKKRKIMYGSILSVHIINAEDLNPGRRGDANAIVKVEIEG